MRKSLKMSIGVAVALAVSMIVIVAQGQTHTGVGASANGMLNLAGVICATLGDFYAQIQPGTPFGP